jgi:hypothetical protein
MTKLLSACLDVLDPQSYTFHFGPTNSEGLMPHRIWESSGNLGAGISPIFR